MTAVARPCPACQVEWDGSTPRCAACGADLSLLTGLIESVGDGLAAGDAATRDGRLADAVAAYLGVLAIDPTQRLARQRLGWLAMVLPAGRPVPPPRALPWGWLVAVGLALTCGALAGRLWLSATMDCRFRALHGVHICPNHNRCSHDSRVNRSAFQRAKDLAAVLRV